MLAQLAGLDAGLDPEENTRTFFQKLLSRSAKIVGVRRLMVFEGRAGGREPILLAWYGVRPGPKDRTWGEVAQATLQQTQPFFPDAEFYTAKEIEVPKITLASAPIRAYDRTLAALVIALPQETDPNLIMLLAGQIGLHFYNRQANIRAAGLTARSNLWGSQLQALFEGAPLAIIRVEGQLLRLNQRAAELFGLSATERTRPLTLDALTLLQPDGATAFSEEQSPLNRALTLGETIQNEAVVLRRPDNSRIPIQLSVSPIFSQDKQITGAFLFLRDEEKEKE